MDASPLIPWIPLIVAVVNARRASLATPAGNPAYRAEAARCLMKEFAEFCGLAFFMTAVDVGFRLACSRRSV